jgi:hypothetical protein
LSAGEPLVPPRAPSLRAPRSAPSFQEPPCLGSVQVSALRLPVRARSSAGQSSGLIIRWSLVRIQAGPLVKLLHGAISSATSWLCG